MTWTVQKQSMDSRESLSQNCLFKNWPRKENRRIVTRALQIRVEGRIAISISCPPLRADGLADYLNPQPQHRGLFLHYYHTFVIPSLTVILSPSPIAKSFKLELGDLPPSACAMCRRPGRLGSPTRGTAFERVDMSRKLKSDLLLERSTDTERSAICEGYLSRI